MFIEINLYKKCFIGNFYNPSKSIRSHLPFLSKCLYHYLQFMTMSFYLVILTQSQQKLLLHGFCQLYNLLNLIKVPTCFKNPQNPSCIDLILTNRHNCFQNSIAIETGLSDFHKMTITVLKLPIKRKHLRLFLIEIIKTFQRNTSSWS